MQHFLHDSVALLSLCNAKIATAGSNRDLQSAAVGGLGFGSFTAQTVLSCDSQLLQLTQFTIFLSVCSLATKTSN